MESARDPKRTLLSGALLLAIETSMIGIARKFPFLTWAFFALLLDLVIQGIGIEYDDPYWGLLVITASVWGFIFWLPNEILSEFNFWPSIPYRTEISIGLGIGLAGIGDWALAAWRNYRSAKTS